MQPWHRGLKKETEDLWGPRIGLRAARLYWWSALVVRRGFLVGVATFLLIAVPVWMGWAFAGPWAWVIGVSAVVFGFSGFVALLMARRSASKILGVRITGKDSPPGDREDYITWCRRNGVAAPFDPGRRR